MSTFTKDTEQYIGHEVSIRLHEHKFEMLETRIDKMDHKLNFIIGIMLGTIILPAAMKYLHLL